MKYHKKPEVVDAVRWFPGVQIGGVRESTYDSRQVGYLSTPSGEIMVEAGDWVLTTDLDGKKSLRGHEWFLRNYEIGEGV